LKEKYAIDESTLVLGVQPKGLVIKTHLIADSSKQVAIKALERKKLTNRECIISEMQTLKLINHPNISQYLETYEDKHYLFLTMEFVSGTSLEQILLKEYHNKLPEATVQLYMRQLLSAVKEVHSKGLSHRGIEPKNIVIAEDVLKIIDFGVEYSAKRNNLHPITGTPYYMSPEVLEGMMTPKADIWALGVIMYLLLSGFLPFQGKCTAEVFMQIKDGRFNYTPHSFALVSSEAKDLIKKLLVVNIKKRLAAH
jgi:calcium-dependent protein kinase